MALEFFVSHIEYLKKILKPYCSGRVHRSTKSGIGCERKLHSVSQQKLAYTIRLEAQLSVFCCCFFVTCTITSPRFAPLYRKTYKKITPLHFTSILCKLALKQNCFELIQAQVLLFLTRITVFGTSATLCVGSPYGFLREKLRIYKQSLKTL